MLIGLTVLVIIVAIWYWRSRDTVPVQTSTPSTVTMPPIQTDPVIAQPSPPISTITPDQQNTQPNPPSAPSLLETILAPVISIIHPTVSNDTSPTQTTPTQVDTVNTTNTDPTAIPTPAEIIAINSGVTPPQSPTPVVDQPSSSQTVPQVIEQPTQTPPTQTAPTQTTPTQTPAPVEVWCKNGVYCNGKAIPQSGARVGMSACGKYNIKHTCTAQPNGDPKWVDHGIICNLAWGNACEIPTKVVTGNGGTVSGNTYCAGINGASWNGSLPADWNGAKCVSAGFNATGTPAGVGCDTIPGQKPGFRIICQKTGTGWYGAPQVVTRNDGTVSATRYCAGVNGKPWNSELPASWNGAKCVSAGFNATGTPTGVGCDVVPGSKPGFRILCAPTNSGWK